MYDIILIIHVVICVALIGMILIQQGKGAEVGAAFGSGASQTVFGSQGSGNFITRTTAILATLFFATSLSLGYIASHNSRKAASLDLPITTMSQEKKPVSDVPDFGSKSSGPASSSQSK